MAVMDIVGSAIEVTKESPRTMALASTLGFFKAADKVRRIFAAAAAVGINIAKRVANAKVRSV